MAKRPSLSSADKVLEDKVETRFTEGVTALGGIAFKFKPFGIIGVPDRIVLLPGGILMFVELKKWDGTVKPWQQRMHDKLRELGFRVEVLFGYADVSTFFEAMSWLN